MAKKAANREPAPGNKRYRRSDDELIADLKAKIAQLKARADTKKLKESPSVKRTLTLVRTLDKALEDAQAEKNTELRRVLHEARQPIADYLDQQGVRLPRPRRPRGRRPRA